VCALILILVLCLNSQRCTSIHLQHHFQPACRPMGMLPVCPLQSALTGFGALTSPQPHPPTFCTSTPLCNRLTHDVQVIMMFAHPFWPEGFFDVVCTDSFIPEFWVTPPPAYSHQHEKQPRRFRHASQSQQVSVTLKLGLHSKLLLRLLRQRPGRSTSKISSKDNFCSRSSSSRGSSHKCSSTIHSSSSRKLCTVW